MNKWVKRMIVGAALVLAVLMLILMFPMALVSLGTGVITMFLYLIVIGILLLKRNKSYVWIGAVVLMFLYLHTFTAPAVTGRIVDKTTKKPIENAIVHAEYYLTFPTVGGNVGYTIGESLAVTDIDGKYRLRPKISIGTSANRYEGIYGKILYPFISFLDMFSPKVKIKVLQPLWEAREKWIVLHNNNYSWMINKFPLTIRHDEEMLSLGEINKGKNPKDKKEFTLRAIKESFSDSRIGYCEKRRLIKILKVWKEFGGEMSSDWKKAYNEKLDELMENL